MSLPANVHVSQHPSLLAKLSQLRASSTSAKEVKALIHEIGLILSIEALAKVTASASGPKVCSPPKLVHWPAANERHQDQTPLGFEYTTTTISPSTISIVPILRSGLGMVEGELPFHSSSH